MPEPGKFAPGLRGFPTPNTAAGISAYLLFLFNDPIWAQYILGACEPLGVEYNWYEAGDMLPDEAAEAFRVIVEQAPYNTTNSDIQAPFWDEESGDDADDTAPVDAQTWYGTWDGETFLETVSYVFLTNFLSTLISPQAAIKFLTIPRAFRVAIRQNPHGANLLLFLDGGLYKVINGYSPVDQIAEFIIASPGTEMLLVVDSTHDPAATPDENGNYVVDVVRKRLSESEVTDPNTRYFGTPPVYQTTDDGGVTWMDTPTADVRYSPAAIFPLLTPYTGIECDVAARMTAQLKASIDLMCSVGDAAQAVTGLMELILLPTGLVGVLLSLFFTVCDWIIDNGQATILAAFTTAVYEDITCTLQCFISPDGSIAQASLDAAWDTIKADHPGTIATVIDEVRFIFTDVIFTNAGIKRTETGDCSGCASCDWVVEYDFSTGAHGFSLPFGGATTPRGTYDGVKFVGSTSGGQIQLFLEKQIAGLHITGISTYRRSDKGSGGGNFRRLANLTVITPLTITTISSTSLFDQDPVAWVNDFADVFVTTLGFTVDYGASTNNTGFIEVYKMRVAGTGTPPTDGIRVTSL